jgi:SAM-dependent methyltransferase
MTTLDSLKDAWESLAEHDALHAILTDTTKVGGRWNIAEFMATGNAEIEMLMEHLSRLCYVPNRDGVALDFGCGVGRLTQALGHYFNSCVGLDISPAMVHQAQSLNELPHCRYIATSDIPLPLPTDAFSFIYSNIVLQHIPRRFAKKYLRELIRVLKPGGLLVFGVQDSYAMPNLSSLLTRLRHIIHIRSRMHVALRIGSGDMQMHCLPERTVRHILGVSRVLDLQFTNTAAKDFNGRLVYLERAPRSGYVSKQYCVVK